MLNGDKVRIKASLMYRGKIVGARCVLGAEAFDVDVDCLQTTVGLGVTRGLPTKELLTVGDELCTQDELDSGVTVRDLSTDSSIMTALIQTYGNPLPPIATPTEPLPDVSLHAVVRGPEDSGVLKNGR